MFCGWGAEVILTAPKCSLAVSFGPLFLPLTTEWYVWKRNEVRVLFIIRETIVNVFFLILFPCGFKCSDSRSFGTYDSWELIFTSHRNSLQIPLYRALFVTTRIIRVHSTTKGINPVKETNGGRGSINADYKLLRKWDSGNDVSMSQKSGSFQFYGPLAHLLPHHAMTLLVCWRWREWSYRFWVWKLSCILSHCQSHCFSVSFSHLLFNF